MPINRPNLQLNLSPLNLEPHSTRAVLPSAYEHLKNNLDLLNSQMRKMPTCHFKEMLNAPDYYAVRQSGFFTMSQGFQLNNDSNDVFVHARRELPQSQGKFAGDKFHISVLKDNVPQAFKVLSGLLFSEDSPVDKWKVTDMERVDSQARVSLGAQFTLYIKPDQENSQYSVSFLHKTRQFIEFLEVMLSENGMTSGRCPESDVQPENWQYLSYRNELRSGREGGEIQSQALREEPFYRLMTE